MITRDHIVQWLYTAAAVIEQNKEHLTRLDAAIGDADHGANMDRGFQKVAEQLPTVSSHDIGDILKAVAMALISTVGGASGPLYGTLFMRTGLAAKGKTELDGVDRVVFFGIVQKNRLIEGELPRQVAFSGGVHYFRAVSIRLHTQYPGGEPCLFQSPP